MAWADPTGITSLSSIGTTGDYVITADIEVPSTFTSIASFSGTLEAAIDPDTKMPYRIKNLSAPLFTTLTGTVKNLVLEDVNITSGTDVGAIACNVTGTSTKKAVIYNCGILSGSVTGSDNVGGLVGVLGSTSDNDQCYARVINCYSFADIKGGSVKGGIVGYNCFASKYNNLRSMVMNCMFYGDIATGGSVSPIYGGENISNDYGSTAPANTANRLNSYNYFLYEAPFSKEKNVTTYNCALAAEERFLVRFEFYRHLLNSTRELAAWYATGTATQNSMLKWVLDKSIASYPILKEQGKYPSVVNYDPDYTNDPDTGERIARSTITKRNHGGIIKEGGTSQSLTIFVSNTKTTGGQTWPTGANISETYRPGSTGITRYRTDKDVANYNFNYDKVQLPYYNDVGSGNYTGNRVVTGWKIVSMTGGTSGGYSEENYDYPNYNYADRDTYGKDIYTSGTGNSGRIFAQGAYFNVPKGVKSITIEPYWGISAYLSDANYDRYGYNNNDDLTQVGDGPRYTDNTDCPVLTGNQKVFTTISGAVGALTGVSGSATVYDYAVVLVGNYHHHVRVDKYAPELSSGSTPFTIMSIDLNRDNEPDYCLIYRSGKNLEISPIRFDFITVPGMAMAHKMATNENLAIPGNCCPKGWFEITTTGLIKYSQFEHSYNNKTNAPVIFMGGVIDQFVANNTGSGDAFNNKTKYMLFGDNVWFKMLSNGNHMDKSSRMPHRPISLVGGEYEALYLSGFFRPDAAVYTTGDVSERNAECYIDGGKFGDVAGAGQENLNGNITWIIDHADIRSFYGGGQKVVNGGSQVTGNISTTIKNSSVDIFSGGPKFGDMAAGKTVKTTANNCTFGTYFGAGYGGTSILKEQFYNVFQKLNYNEWNTKVNGTYKNGTRGKYTEGKGVAVNYEYEFFAGTAGNVHRLYLWYASFSLAQTNDVTSKLTGCTVNNNFYGGGSLGAVSGNVTSTLTDCTVLGNVFGAGYSVNIPTVDVRPLRANPYIPEPIYNISTGVYEEGIPPANDSFTWSHGTVANGGAALDESDTDHLVIKTNETLDDLGAVTGNVILTLNGSTVVGTVGDNTTGNVYGGGEASAVKGSNKTITVNIQGSTHVLGNVFGGGDKGLVEGSAVVNIQDE